MYIYNIYNVYIYNVYIYDIWYIYTHIKISQNGIWMNYNDLTSWRHWNDALYMGNHPQIGRKFELFQVRELLQFIHIWYCYILFTSDIEQQSMILWSIIINLCICVHICMGWFYDELIPWPKPHGPLALNVLNVSNFRAHQISWQNKEWACRSKFRLDGAIIFELSPVSCWKRAVASRYLPPFRSRKVLPTPQPWQFSSSLYLFCRPKIEVFLGWANSILSILG